MYGVRSTELFACTSILKCGEERQESKHALSHVKMDGCSSRRVPCPVAPSRFEFHEMRHGQLLTRLLVPGPKHALSLRLGDEARKKRKCHGERREGQWEERECHPGRQLKLLPLSYLVHIPVFVCISRYIRVLVVLVVVVRV
ncbi:hypothetical protein CI102_2031 [Trichoderma harzianum]|uniref:Uncharacterized protein n=1 Tax=Trichoderma harzianum CBS 226.95 TaxID=983964 RepID=A0A2T4A3N5_TRIHA|nr:hypothetical protein M431DRAFT_224965 [Trichoderma harzianum CBS 226.95]PKK53583.1 hypothetical protein CI102_2031 [Trichoderma harzianum]PTB51671.1 hypothetical protein M431DRAFT_224965 [Trichoderma harzianum CBS 226.95]